MMQETTSADGPGSGPGLRPGSYFDLRGQVALVTGATGGLGRAIVEALAARGATVLAADRQWPEAPAPDTAVDAAAADAGRVIPLQGDLSQAAEVERLADAALALSGRVDILVCNAGMQGPAGPLAEAGDADWQAVFEVNLRSAARLSSRLLPGMAQRGHGRVVLMASIAGLRGNRAIGLYGLSKAALAQLARNIAVEWGPQGISANAVAPGLIRTPLATRLLQDESFMRRRLAQTPLRRVGDPHEIAALVLLLAGPAGGFITGQTLVVDGGTTISDGS